MKIQSIKFNSIKDNKKFEINSIKAFIFITSKFIYFINDEKKIFI